MDSRSDEVLAAEVARGDPAALRLLYLRHEVPIYNFLVRLTRNREMAQDLMQETFTRVWTKARTFHVEGGRFKGWLFTIALNLARSELGRKRHNTMHVEEGAIDGLVSGAESPYDILARSDDARRVADALAALPDPFREVVVMKVYHQLKFSEIAEITHTSEGTLKARFHRAVAKLRQSLAPGATR